MIEIPRQFRCKEPKRSQFIWTLFPKHRVSNTNEKIFCFLFIELIGVDRFPAPSRRIPNFNASTARITFPKGTFSSWRFTFSQGPHTPSDPDPPSPGLDDAASLALPLTVQRFCGHTVTNLETMPLPVNNAAAFPRFHPTINRQPAVPS